MHHLTEHECNYSTDCICCVYWKFLQIVKNLTWRIGYVRSKLFIVCTLGGQDRWWAPLVICDHGLSDKWLAEFYQRTLAFRHDKTIHHSNEATCNIMPFQRISFLSTSSLIEDNVNHSSTVTRWRIHYRWTRHVIDNYKLMEHVFASLRLVDSILRYHTQTWSEPIDYLQRGFTT